MKSKLKNTSVMLDKEKTWYYEEGRGIYIVHWVTDSNGHKHAEHIKIGWAKLRDSVQRKYGVKIK